LAIAAHYRQSRPARLRLWWMLEGGCVNPDNAGRVKATALGYVV
jgi:hypothetical protein